MHVSLKQLTRWTGQPAFHLSLKVEVREMANDAGHGDIAVAPRAAKIEVEQVVLDILVPPNRHLRLSVCLFNPLPGDPPLSLTVRILPPDRCWATAFAIAGFSATHRILDIPGHSIDKRCHLPSLYVPAPACIQSCSPPSCRRKDGLFLATRGGF